MKTVFDGILFFWLLVMGVAFTVFVGVLISEALYEWRYQRKRRKLRGRRP